MCDGDDRSGILLQVMLQPGNGLRIEVVGRLVEEEDLRLFEEEAAERDPAPFPSGEKLDRSLGWGAAQGIHGHLKAAVEIPSTERLELLLHLSLPIEQRRHLVVGHRISEAAVDLVIFAEQVDDGLHPPLDDLPDRFGVVEGGLLLEQSDGISGGEDDLALILPVEPGDDPQEAALSRSVETENTDLRSVEEPEVNIFEDCPLVVKLADPNHREDHFIRRLAHTILYIHLRTVD